MRGTGYRCDDCAVMVIDERDPFQAQSFTTTGTLPAGWVAVVAERSAAVNEFCSWACVERFARRAAPKAGS